MLNRLRNYFFNRKKTDDTAVSGQSFAARLKAANRWREQSNPMRGLTIARVVSMREAFLRGDMAEIQWTYELAEQSNEDLMALASRRLGAIADLEWQICLAEKSDNFDDKLAKEQAMALREAYNRITNLNEAIEHLAMATFRGYSHLEKHLNAVGDVVELFPAHQWNLVRDGRYGAWRFNAAADGKSFLSLGSDCDVLPEDWIIREVARHIDWIGLALYVRENMGRVYWDGFVEVYGVPGAIVIGPQNVPAGKSTEYETAAQAVAEGGSGYLPFGSIVEFPSDVRGQNPFRDYLDYCTEKLILAGTGGKLTMLSSATGIGKGPSEEQADVFKDIASAEAKQISEVFQRQFDKILLDKSFPGKPILAYFKLASNQSNSSDTISFKREAWKLLAQQNGAIALNSTDFKVLSRDAGVPENIEYVEPYMPVSTTGKTITDDDGNVIGAEPRPSVMQQIDGMMKANGEDDDEEDVMKNRRLILPQKNRPVGDAARAVISDLKPVADRLRSILAITDPELFKTRLLQFRAEMDALEVDIDQDPALAKVIADEMGAAMERAIK